MLTHEPINRYLASRDAESAGAAAPDGASPRRLRTPPQHSTPNELRVDANSKLIGGAMPRYITATCSVWLNLYS